MPTWTKDPWPHLDALRHTDADMMGLELPGAMAGTSVLRLMLGRIEETVAGTYGSPERVQFELLLLSTLLAREKMGSELAVTPVRLGQPTASADVSFSNRPEAARRRHELADGGRFTLNVEGVDVEVISRLAVGTKPYGMVYVTVHHLPGQLCRQGALACILECAGYPGIVVRESLGWLLDAAGDCWPLGSTEHIRALVRVPIDDPYLQHLPGSFSVWEDTITIDVQGRPAASRWPQTHSPPIGIRQPYHPPQPTPAENRAGVQAQRGQYNELMAGRSGGPHPFAFTPLSAGPALYAVHDTRAAQDHRGVGYGPPPPPPPQPQQQQPPPPPPRRQGASTTGSMQEDEQQVDDDMDEGRGGEGSESEMLDADADAMLARLALQQATADAGGGCESQRPQPMDESELPAEASTSGRTGRSARGGRQRQASSPTRVQGMRQRALPVGTPPAGWKEDPLRDTLGAVLCEYYGQHLLFSTPEQRVHAVRSFAIDRKDLWAANKGAQTPSDIGIQIHDYFASQLPNNSVGMDSFSESDDDSRGPAQARLPASPRTGRARSNSRRGSRQRDSPPGRSPAAGTSARAGAILTPPPRLSWCG